MSQTNLSPSAARNSWLRLLSMIVKPSDTPTKSPSVARSGSRIVRGSLRCRFPRVMKASSMPMHTARWEESLNLTQAAAECTRRGAALTRPRLAQFTAEVCHRAEARSAPGPSLSGRMEGAANGTQVLSAGRCGYDETGARHSEAAPSRVTLAAIRQHTSTPRPKS